MDDKVHKQNSMDVKVYKENSTDAKDVLTEFNGCQSVQA